MMGCKAVETSLSCLSRDSWCRWPTRLQGWSSSLAPVCVATDDIFSAYILHGWCLLSPSGDLVVKLVRDRPHQLCNVVLFIPFVQIIPSGQIAIYVPNVTVLYLHLWWSCSSIRIDTSNITNGHPLSNPVLELWSLLTDKFVQWPCRLTANESTWQCADCSIQACTRLPRVIPGLVNL